MAVGVQIGFLYPAGSTVFFVLYSWSSGFSLLLVPRSCLQSRFLQLHFRGSGVFTDEWDMVLAATIRARPLLVIIFLLISENSTVLASGTGQSYVACSVLTVSASDAVFRVCFGVLWSLSSFWFLPHFDKFLGCLDLTLLRRMDVIDVQKIYLSYAEWTSLTSIVKSFFQKLRKMLFSFKNKYHYTYPNTYIALYHSHAKLPVTHTHTHTQKQEIVNHPS